MCEYGCELYLSYSHRRSWRHCQHVSCPRRAAKLGSSTHPPTPLPPTLFADKPVDDNGIFDSIIQNENKNMF